MNPLLRLVIEVAKTQLTLEEQNALRDALIRTCATCAQSESKDPKCGLCVGPTSKQSLWEPK